MSSSPPAEQVPPPALPARARRRLAGWPRSLTSRLVLGTVVLVALTSLFVAVVTTLALRQFLLQRLDDQLMAVADRSTEAMSPGGRPDGPPPTDPCLTPFEGPGRGLDTMSGVVKGECTQVTVVTDKLAEQKLDSVSLRTLQQLPPDGRPHTVELEDFGSYRVILTDADGNVLVTGLSLKGANATVERLAMWEALVAIVAVALAATAGLFLVRRQLRPLQQVASTARQVSDLPLESGRVGVTGRVPPELTDPDTEVGQMGEALNVLLSSVEGAFEARHASEQRVRQFVADASHELRTPLSTIQGYAELSRRGGPQDRETLLRSMAKVESESHRMAALVDDLLLLARLDSGRPLERDDVDLTRMVIEGVNDARVVAPDHQWRLKVPDEPVQVVGDEQRLHQALSNLIGNARRHTPPGTTVLLAVRELDDPHQVELSVTDDGPGLTPALANNVFERFSRGDSSRTRQSGGAGLGLSIVKAIVEAHGGSATVASRPGRTAFSLSLPRVHSAATE